MLINTKDQLLEYAELTAAINFTSVKKTLKSVERDHIVPIIGTLLYTAISADESTLNDKQKALLEACRCVIGPMLVYHYTPKSEVKIGDAGAQRMETANAKTAYQNQVANFREQNLREAEAALEALYKLLDENKADYPDWTDTQAEQDYNSLFIRTGSDFARLFPSASPYRNFYAIRPVMDDVQEMILRPILGDDLFADLLDKEVTAATLSSQEFQLIRRMKKLIAYRTIADAIPLLNVRIDANGITIMSKNSALNDQVNARQAADANALNALITTCRDNAQKFRSEVIGYLAANAASFPLYPQPAAPAPTPEYKGLFSP